MEWIHKWTEATRQATVVEARLVSGDGNSSSQMSMYPPFFVSEPLAIERKQSRSTVKCYELQQSPETLSGSRVQWNKSWVLEFDAFRNTGDSREKKMGNWKGHDGKRLYSPGRTQYKSRGGNIHTEVCTRGEIETIIHYYSKSYLLVQKS